MARIPRAEPAPDPPRPLGGVRNYLLLGWSFFRIGLIGETAYRVNFFLQLFQSLLELATAVAGLAVIFSHTQTLGDWRPDEVLALVGVYFLVGGLIGLVIQPSMEELITSVREGTLDFTLLKPEDAQLLVSIRSIDVWQSLDVLMGAGVLAAALIRLGQAVGSLQAAAFGVMLLCGAIIIYSFWLILATLSFWFVRVENILEVFQSMYEAGRWPISLYPGWLRFALTFVVPVAFAVTVPAEALTGRLDPPTVLGTAALAVFLFLLARVIWRAGLHRYSGASA
jgi:ABC-2 type transport system permease protein